MQHRIATVHGFPRIAWNVFLRDRARCQYCRRSGLEDFQSWRELGLDALLPPDAVGAYEESSLAVCCRGCQERLREFEADSGPDDYAFDPRAALRPAEAHAAYESMRRLILGFDVLRERGLAS